jgi:hypothetical protein
MGIVAQDLNDLKTNALRVFEDRVRNVDPDLCYEFDQEIGRLEAQTLQLYAMAAITAKREEESARVAELWKMMVSICDEVASRMKALCDQHPACTASHDKILDLRNKCARLAELHG